MKNIYYIDIFLFLFPIFFIFIFDRNISIKSFFIKQGFTKISFKKLLICVFLIFLLLLLFSVLLTIISLLFNISDLHLVTDIFSNYSISVIIYLFIIRIFLEEWFFRAFLVPRVGVLFSSLIFGLAHFGYGSIIEIIGAFALGFLIAKIYSINKNIFCVYFAHLLYNTLILVSIM